MRSTSEDVRTPTSKTPTPKTTTPRTKSVFGSSLKRGQADVERSVVKFVAQVDIQEYSQSEFNVNSSSNKNYQEERERVFEIVEKNYSEELKALKLYLQTELNELRKRSSDFRYPFTIHPAASYFLHQYMLCCTELVMRFEKKKISYRNFREFAANLSVLYENMVWRARINEEYSGVGMLMAWTLWKLFEAWDGIAMVFEDAQHKQMTDWMEVGTRVREVFGITDRKPNIKAMSKPPVDLTVLTPPYMIGSSNFGTIYFSQLGRVPLLIRAASRKLDADGLRECQMRVFAQSACQLRHPLIERYLATAILSDTYIACSDALYGINVSQLVQKVFPQHGCPLELTRIVVAQVGLALFYLHFNGYIHLDVQATNIMVSSTCRVKLMGQESAKLCLGLYNIHRKREYFRRTSRELMGKENFPDLQFCPPEILKNYAYGRAVDWWYLGALAFFMYYNKKPFQGRNERETAGQILRGRLRMKRTSVKGFTNFKLFIHDALNPKSKRRLCSKSYAQFLKHRFFRGMIWEVLEKSNAIIELFEIEKHMEPCDDHWIPPRSEPRKSRTERDHAYNHLNLTDDKVVISLLHRLIDLDRIDQKSQVFACLTEIHFQSVREYLVVFELLHNFNDAQHRAVQSRLIP